MKQFTVTITRTRVDETRMNVEDAGPREHADLAEKIAKTVGDDEFVKAKTQFTATDIRRAVEPYTTFDCPAWALCAIVNGDESGLSDKDLADMNAFIATLERQIRKEFGEGATIIYAEDSDAEEYFSTSQQFGLPCNCVTMEVFAKKGTV